MWLLQVARDAVLKDAPRAAKGEDSAVATALAEPPKSRRRISSFSWPPAGTSFPPCAGEDAVDVVVRVVNPVSEIQQVEVSRYGSWTRVISRNA